MTGIQGSDFLLYDTIPIADSSIFPVSFQGPDNHNLQLIFTTPMT